jgi:hypothetical protein
MELRYSGTKRRGKRRKRRRGERIASKDRAHREQRTSVISANRVQGRWRAYKKFERSREYINGEYYEHCMDVEVANATWKRDGITQEVLLFHVDEHAGLPIWHVDVGEITTLGRK